MGDNRCPATMSRPASSTGTATGFDPAASRAGHERRRNRGLPPTLLHQIQQQPRRQLQRLLRARHDDDLLGLALHGPHTSDVMSNRLAQRSVTLRAWCRQLTHRRRRQCFIMSRFQTPNGNSLTAGIPGRKGARRPFMPNPDWIACQHPPTSGKSRRGLPDEGVLRLGNAACRILSGRSLVT